MNLHRIDLNLLVYLDTLLRERNVTQAAQQLNLSQPAMSNGLRRLRNLFDDPLLVRTSRGHDADGARPRARTAGARGPGADRSRGAAALGLPPGEAAEGVFRIMASDYAESTLFPAVLGACASRRRASPWTS
jgi:DNA-binding transcriptional LysR family regulator